MNEKNERKRRKESDWLAGLLYIFPHPLYMILRIHMMILRIQSVSFKNTHTFSSSLPFLFLISFSFGPSALLVRFILGIFLL